MSMSMRWRAVASALVAGTVVALVAPTAVAVESQVVTTESVYYSNPVLNVEDVELGDVAELEILWGGEGDVDRIALQYSYQGYWWPMPGQDKTVYDGRSTWSWTPLASRDYRAVYVVNGNFYLLDTFSVDVIDGPTMHATRSSSTVAMGDTFRSTAITTGVPDGTPVTMTEYNSYEKNPGKVVEQGTISSGRAPLYYAPGMYARYYVCADLGEGYEVCDDIVVSVSGKGYHADPTPSYVPGTRLEMRVYSTSGKLFKLYYTDPEDRERAAAPVVTRSPFGTYYIPLSDLVVGELVEPAQSANFCVPYSMYSNFCSATLIVAPRPGRHYMIATDQYLDLRDVESDIIPRAVAPEMRLLQASEYREGQYVDLAVYSNVAFTGTGRVYYQDPGGSWVRSSKTVAIEDGWGSVTVKPKGPRRFMVRVGAYASDVEVPTPAGLELTVDAPQSMPAGTVVDLDVVLAGPAWATKGELWFRDGEGTWHRSSKRFNLRDGEATVQVKPRVDREYQVRVRDVASAVYAPEVIALDLNATLDATYVPGERLDLAVSSEPAFDGDAEVWFRDGSGRWIRSSQIIPLVDGSGVGSVKPRLGRTYQVRLGGARSAVLSPQAVPLDITVAPAQYLEGEPALLDVTVDPAVTVKGVVQYRDHGGAWRTSSRTVALVDGSGSVELKAREGREYRIVVAGQPSTPYEPELIPIEISLSVPGEYVAGARADLEATCAPLEYVPCVSGTGELWYRDNGGSWVRSGSLSVPFVDGAGTVNVRPRAGREYQVRLEGHESNLLDPTTVSAL